MSQETPARSGSAPLGFPVPPGYEILEELGRGGMGVVYKARNTLMDRLEVLKVVNQQLLGPGAGVERFLREIRSAAKLSHPNIVAAYTAYQIEGALVFAMEYVAGADLAKVVAGRGPLPVANACHYIQQAALGLQHAFEKGMVHRDVKPQNLILHIDAKKHTVKILDFGLAKATHEGQDKTTRLTVLGKTMGTPDYIAPEQVRDAASADIRADVYSLGCTLYFLLSGEPPFPAHNLHHLLYAHQSLAATPLNEIRGEVPPELAAVVARMMAKEPAQRYQQPAEVLPALAPFVKAGLQPVSPQPAVAKPARDQQQWSPEQRALLNQGNCIKPPLDYSGERLTSSRVLRTILRIWNIDPGGDGCRPKTLRNFLHRSLQALPIPGWSVPNGTPCWTSSSLPSAPPWATPTAGPTSNASARPNSTSFARSWTCPTASRPMTPSAGSSPA